MSDAAHPQPATAEPADATTELEPATAANPFPSVMTVPGLDGEEVEVKLEAIDGVVYAPDLDALHLAPHVRQYVTQYCAAWSSSVLTLGKLQDIYVEPPRRAQVAFHESQLRAMLGLVADETLVAVVSDPVANVVRFIVESPRLPRKQAWNVEPGYITLPIAAHYEQPGQVVR